MARPAAIQYCATFLKPEMLHIYRQITGLRRYQPIVVCQKRENADTFPFDPVVVLPKPATHQLRRLWQKQILRRPIQIYRSEARRILEETRRQEASLVHIYFGHIGVHLLPFIEISPVPVVVSFHGADAMVGLDQRAYRSAMQRMLSLARLLLVRSESLTERLVALGCSPEKIALHRTGIPTDDLIFQQRTAPGDGAWRFVQASRLIAKKGLHTSLRAFAGFARRFSQATFTIAGEGPLQGDLEKLAGDLGVRDRVVFTGFLPQPQLRDLYREAHVFLHPSQLGPDGNQEGVPNSMLEAMAMGLPVLATTHGGIPEAVESGVSGLLVDEGNAEALERAMLDLVTRPDQYAAMSAAAARAVAAKFEQAEQVRVLERCYDRALA